MTIQEVPEPKRTQACGVLGCKRAYACIAMESKRAQAYTHASNHRSDQQVLQVVVQACGRCGFGSFSLCSLCTAPVTPAPPPPRHPPDPPTPQRPPGPPPPEFLTDSFGGGSQWDWVQGGAPVQRARGRSAFSTCIPQRGYPLVDPPPPDQSDHRGATYCKTKSELPPFFPLFFQKRTKSEFRSLCSATYLFFCTRPTAKKKYQASYAFSFKKRVALFLLRDLRFFFIHDLLHKK